MTSSPFGFTVNFAVRDRRCVIIGGGPEAAARIRRLRDASANVAVFSTSPTHGALAAVDARVELHRRPWRRSDLAHALMVIATREEPLDAAALYTAGRAEGALVAVLDDRDHCDFASVSLLQHGDFHVAVSTNGRAPAVAKAARRRLEAVFDERWGKLTETADHARRALLPRTIPFDEWAGRWAHALEDVEHLLQRLGQGDEHGVRRYIEQVVNGCSPESLSDDDGRTL